MTLQDAVRQLRGDPGTKITFSVFRAKAKDPGEKIKDYTITRDIIKPDSVKDAKLLEDGIGYVRITQFNEPTTDEFERALTKLEKQGMDALIVDLRNNPGGLLEAACKVAGKFIPAGQLIVSTEGRHASEKLVYRSDGGKKWMTIPLVILVNLSFIAITSLVAGLPGFTFGEQVQMLRDQVLAMAFSGGCLVAAFGAGMLVSDDMQNGMIPLIMSRPKER